MKEILKPDATLQKLLPKAQPRSGTKYVPSQFAVPFAYKDRQFVFHTLTKQCMETELPASVKAGEGYDDLITAQFLVPEDKDECAYYGSISALMRLHGRKKGIAQYIVLPTTGCNARCVYCFEENRKPVTMTPEIIEQTIRFILDTHAEGEVEIEWFGGEPLLCPDIIDRISEGLRDAGISYRSSMISNGSLITPEIIRKMTELWNLKKIQVSMDGAEQDYRFRKRYYADRDQYRSVMEAVSRMSEAGIEVSIRCNVDEENLDRIPQFLDDLKTGIPDKQNVGLFFAPLNAARLSDRDTVLWKKIVNVRPLIREAGFKPMEADGLKLQFRTFHCMADSDSAVIDSDGTLHACNEFPEGSRYGDIFNGVTDAAAKQAFCRTDRIREKCRKCPYLPDCTGFASCPVQDRHCREVRELITLYDLRSLIDKADEDRIRREEP